jgi:hypothetical protein
MKFYHHSLIIFFMLCYQVAFFRKPGSNYHPLRLPSIMGNRLRSLEALFL